MAWRQKATERIADYLRFFGQGAILLNGITLALGSVYFILKFVWFSLRYLDRTLFGNPW